LHLSLTFSRLSVLKDRKVFISYYIRKSDEGEKRKGYEIRLFKNLKRKFYICPVAMIPIWRIYEIDVGYTDVRQREYR